MKLHAHFYESYSVKALQKLWRAKLAIASSSAQAIHCSLSDVIPLNGTIWTEACTNRFISVAHQKLVTIVATGNITEN